MFKNSVEKSVDSGEATQTKAFSGIRVYSIALLLALLFIHALAFFAYRFIEQNELQSQLAAFSQTLDSKAFDEHSAEISRFPDGIVVLRNEGREGRAGFYERRIAGREYLIYSAPQSDLIVAKSEEVINREFVRFGAILAALYIGELIIFFSWWAFVKDKVRQLFEI